MVTREPSEDVPAGTEPGLTTEGHPENQVKPGAGMGTACRLPCRLARGTGGTGPVPWRVAGAERSGPGLDGWRGRGLPGAGLWLLLNRGLETTAIRL